MKLTIPPRWDCAGECVSGACDCSAAQSGSWELAQGRTHPLPMSRPLRFAACPPSGGGAFGPNLCFQAGGARAASSADMRLNSTAELVSLLRSANFETPHFNDGLVIDIPTGAST